MKWRKKLTAVRSRAVTSDHTLTLCLMPYMKYRRARAGTSRHEVALLVETLCYNSEGRGFDSRWCHWNFSLIKSFRPHYCPEVDSASNRNEYQEHFLVGKGGRCVGLTTLPRSCVDCLAIWETQCPGTLWACPSL